mgnify:CR=1 FL=1
MLRDPDPMYAMQFKLLMILVGALCVAVIVKLERRNMKKEQKK